MNDDGCPAFMGDTWRKHRCGKPIKSDGLCGVHAAGKRRREANDAQRDAEVKAEKERRALADHRCAALKAAGIAAMPYYDSISHTYTGGVVLSPSNADGVIAKLQR